MQSSFTKKLLLSFFLSISSVSTSLLSKVIVWDLNGVLLTSSRFGMAREIGLPGIILDTLLGGDAKKRMFAFLNETFGYQSSANPYDPKNAQYYAMGDGLPLPEIWCQNMKGLSGNDVLKQISPKTNGYFSSKRERKVIKKLMKAIFDPTIISQHFYPIKKGAQLLRRVACTPKNTCMILSNLAGDVFDELSKRPESNDIFQHITHENIIISGKIGMMKPYANIYEYLIQKLIMLDVRFADPLFLAQECIFIDDQWENVLAARKLGITSIWFNDGDYKNLACQLKALDAI